MATRVLKFNKLYFSNPYKAFKRKTDKEFSNRKLSIVEREAAETRLIARRSMKKAPMRPKSRFGQEREYGKNTKAYKKGKRRYYQKGMYSRPGHPPFHHGQVFNLKTILYDAVPHPALRSEISRFGARRVSVYRVGPKYDSSKAQYYRLMGTAGRPVPGLQEYGGTVRLRNTQRTRKDRRGFQVELDLTQTGTLRYPERPYMRPAGRIAQRRAEERFFLLNKMKGVRLVKFRKRRYTA
jgi:hypothetical protein